MKTALHRKRVQYILKHGERHVRRDVVVCVLRSGDVCDTGGGFAILISKKVIADAVSRNRLRRVLREVVQASDRGCVDVVVLCRGACGSDAKVREQLQALLREVFGA